MVASSEPREIVIIGGGIIGCSSAYFLTRHPAYDASKHKITILEATDIAGGASGKAGGLLALWAYPKPLVPLSFELHASLAAEHDGAARWGYRRLHVGQLVARGQEHSSPPAEQSEQADGARVPLQKRDAHALGLLRKAGLPAEVDWIDAEAVRQWEAMGTPDDTAQVHPRQFTRAMAELACDKGARILSGRAVTVEQGAAGGAVSGVTYAEAGSAEPKRLAATDVVLAAGPWTRTVYPAAPISALRAHSVTIRPARPVSAHAVFADIFLGGGRVAPELYPRPDGEVYACGEGDQLVPLPATAADVVVDQDRCDAVVLHAGSVSDELRRGQVTARQACYLPQVEGAVAGPLVGLTPVKGLVMAAGHTCWGIQNGPGTGKLVSEFVFDGEVKSAKAGSLDPRQVL